MLHGLTFIAVARKQPDDWNEDRQRRDRLARHRQLVLSPEEHLTDDERHILNQLTEQLTSGELPDSTRHCPECQRRFALANVAGIELDCCRFCRGIWFDPGELQLFSGESKEIPSDDKTSRPSRFRCPDCQTQMVEYVFINPHSLLVNRCPRGHGVYLEDRELERVFEIV